jgi:hypothetical protein
MGSRSKIPPELLELASQKGVFASPIPGGFLVLRDKATGQFLKNSEGGASFSLDQASVFLRTFPDV